MALEACKQCGQNFVTEVFAPVSLEDWLAGRGGERRGLMASLAEGALPLRAGIAELPEELRELDFLIGPEGDFSEGEREAALAEGLRAVSLGGMTLRVETAVLFGLSVLGYELR